MGVMRSAKDSHNCYCLCKAGCQTGVPSFEQISVHLMHLALHLAASVKVPRRQDASVQATPPTKESK